MVIFVFLFLCFHVCAQDFAAEVNIEKTSFQVNEEFKFTIFIPTISPSKLIIEEPKYPDGIEIVTGPSIRPGRNGSIVDYSFKLNKPGRYVIESFKIKNNAKTILTTPVFIAAVSPYQIYGGFNKVPPSARWDIPKDDYYPGEIIPLCFAIENIENPDVEIESVVSQNIDGYVKKISRELEKNKITIITKKVLTGEIYDLLFHDHIFVPFKSGILTLPDLEIYISEGKSDYRTTLKGIPVKISSLPESEENTGALGKYSYEYEISDSKISDSQAVILKQKISGIGNFYGITMPAPYLGNPAIADIYFIKDTYDVAPAGNYPDSPDHKLFKGSREFIYSIRKKSNEISIHNRTYPENVSVIIPDFSWYSKKTSDSFSAESRVAELKLEKSQGTVIILNIEENSFAQPISGIKQEDKEKKIKKSLLEIFKIILIISIVPALFFALKKRIKKSIIALFIIVLAVIIGFLIVTKVLIKQPVYGIVSDGAYAADIYVIPEESATIKFSVKSGETVRIIGEKDQFYLIETDSKGSRGWSKKENIILE